MGKFYNEHPVLTFVLLFVLVIVCIWVKMSIDEKKGENSAEKQKIHEILRQKVSCYGQYIPVYAYQRETYGRKSVKSWHYALGITAEQLYILPLFISETDITVTEMNVIQKNQLGKIDFGTPGGPIYFLKFFDKSGKNIWNITMEEKNTKLDASYPVNVTQVEEVRSFIRKLEQWNEEISKA